MPDTKSSPDCVKPENIPKFPDFDAAWTGFGVGHLTVVVVILLIFCASLLRYQPSIERFFMKLLFVTLIAFLPIQLMAETSIKITSFLRVDSDNLSNRSAEVCGKVTQEKFIHDKVTIIADPGSQQGLYIANIAADGSFCHVVRTAFGVVEAELFTAPAFRSQKISLNQ